jgi:cell division protein FtsW (lipid II flippase)
MLTLNRIGIASAAGAVGMGLVYLAAAGAPSRYLAVNAGTLIIGLAGLMAWRRWARPVPRLPGLAALMIGLALMATALFGQSLDEATRWVRLGPLTLQPGLILTPLLAVLFARDQSLLSTTGVIITAAALALQPDRATAGALALTLAALAVTQPDRRTLAALITATIAFAIALARPDTLPAQPFVEQVLFTAFETHWLIGIAVWIGAKWLLLPAITGRVLNPANRPTYAVFGAVWLGLIAAALLGNYPTPLVGYGASSILGYAMSLAALPSRPQRT